MKFGVHVSIRGGLAKAIDRARERECDTCQIFARNPRGWSARPLSEEEISAFRSRRDESSIEPVVVHTPYLFNLASTDRTLREKSVRGLSAEMQRADLLGTEFLVTHLGSGGPDVSASVRRVAQSINIALDRAGPVDTVLLLENTAGGGRLVGGEFEHIRDIIGGLTDPSRTGFCFDTCHAFVAGYDVRTEKGLDKTVCDMEMLLGKKTLRVVHLNDSKTPVGSRVDRHEHLGRGTIGLRGIGRIINHPSLSNLPAIMETPVGTDPDDDLTNLAIARRLSKV